MNIIKTVVWFHSEIQWKIKVVAFKKIKKKEKQNIYLVKPQITFF